MENKTVTSQNSRNLVVYFILAYAILAAGYTGLEYPKKVYSYLCYIESGPFALPFGSGAGQCSSTGALPPPN